MHGVFRVQRVLQSDPPPAPCRTFQFLRPSFLGRGTHAPSFAQDRPSEIVKARDRDPPVLPVPTIGTNAPAPGTGPLRPGLILPPSRPFSGAALKAQCFSG